MNTATTTRLLAAAGILAGVFYVLGGHFVQPSGDASQGMTDSEIVAWARDSYGALWAGGVVTLAGALLFLAFGLGVVHRLTLWSSAPFLAVTARASVQLTAAMLALGGITQVWTGAASAPGEKLDSESFVPVMTIFYGNLAASAWCLLAPAAVCVAAATGAPRWIRVASGILGGLLLVTVALPPVSWIVGMVWLVAMSAGLLASGSQAVRVMPQPAG